MAIVATKKAVVKVDLASTPTDISDRVQKVSLKITNAVGKAGALGAVFNSAYEGIKDWSVTLTVQIDTTADKASDILADWIMTASPGERTVLIGIPDATTTGSVTWSGEAVIEEISPVNADYNAADSQVMDVTLQGSGTLTQAVVV